MLRWSVLKNHPFRKKEDDTILSRNTVKNVSLVHCTGLSFQTIFEYQSNTSTTTQIDHQIF